MKTSLSQNSVWTGFSIVIVLFIFGIYGIIVIHSSYVGQKIKEQLNIVAEFTKDYNDADKSHLFEELKNHESVLPSSINFFTQDEAKKMMVGELGEAYFEEEGQNPFKDVVVFNVKHEFYEPTFLDQFSSHLKSRDYINDVVYQKEFHELIENNMKDIALIPLIIGLLMCILTIALIYNTVKLTLQSDRRQIKTMTLVGASQSFIKRPYLKSSIRMGLLSSAIAIIFLLIMLQLVSFRLDGLIHFLHYPYVFLTCLMLLLLGVFIPLVSTRLILDSNLKHAAQSQ